MSITNLQAHKRIRKLLKGANARGWQARRGDRNWVATAPMALYVFDIVTGYLASAVLNADVFSNIAGIRDRSPERIWEDTGTLIASMADGLVPNYLKNDATNQMFYMANRYAGTTKTYHLEQPTEGTHFFVMLYRQPRNKELTLRPFAIQRPDTDGLLDADEVHSYIRTMVSVDRDRHPEWLLPSAEIIPFPNTRL